MKALWTSALTLVLTVSFASCGGGSSSNIQPPPPPPAVSISLSEAAVTLTTSSPDYHVNSTHTFTATVHNASNSSVTWKVNGMPGGDSNTGHGTISTTLVYTAPLGIPSDGVTITATSVQDSTKSASATVTLNWYVDNVYVNANGNSTQVKTGEQLQFNASVATLGPSSVTWDVNGVRVGNSTIGALLRSNYFGPTSVTYVAPHTPGTVTITATSDANPTKFRSLPITVVASDPAEPSISITPNDVNLELAKNQQFTASLTNADGWVSWSLARDQSGQLANGYLTGDGSIYNAPFEMPSVSDQVVTACINGYTSKCGYSVIHLTSPVVDPNTRLQGNYVVSLHNPTFNQNLLGIVSADGNGKLQGTADLTANFGAATAQPFTGTYKIGFDGRGSATINYTPIAGMTLNMNVRIVLASDNFGYLYSHDQYLYDTMGVIEKQTASSFTNADLQGSYAFLLRGVAWQTNQSPAVATNFATAGVMKFNADGSLSASGDMTSVPLYQTISGTYTLQTNGMGTAILDFGNASIQYPSHVDFVMVSPGKLYMLTTDDMNSVSADWPLLAGTAEKQSGTFDNSSLSGAYAGYDSGQGWLQLLRFESNGNGTLNYGISDQRDTNTPDAPNVTTGVIFNGGYGVESNGRVNAGFNYGNSANGMLQVKLYLISPSKFYFLIPSSAAAAAGQGYTQTAGSNFDWSNVDGRYAIQFNGSDYNGVGWLMPFGYGDNVSNWIGWFDDLTAIRNDTQVQFFGLEGYGSGRANGISGIMLPWLRYYAVSDSKIMVMSTAPDRSGNVFGILDKLHPVD